MCPTRRIRFAQIRFSSVLLTASRRKTVRTTILFSSIVGLLLGTVAAVRGQSALDGFDPNADKDGVVFAAVVQPDGKILIGGTFKMLSPNGGLTVIRNSIARLNADGTLDTDFNPNANGPVYSIAVQADGKILAGGDFTIIGGQKRNRIARLDATTGLADSFDPNANDTVNAIAVQTDGKILVGGHFNRENSIGGNIRNFIARLDPATGVADAFNPKANGFVFAITVQADGKILVGGAFHGDHGIGGKNRSYIARLDPTTGSADSFNPNANDNVLAIAMQVDGKILAGGSFNHIGGQARNYIARLDATTGSADSFDPNAIADVRSIAIQADGEIVVGGLFTGANSIGGQTRNCIARLDSATGLADSFNPNADNFVYTIAVQADGKILAGGQFGILSPNGGTPVTRNRIARLETDGRADQTLNLTAMGSYIGATALQPDGKILIGGFFSSIMGVARNNIARLNTDGTVDTAFSPNANGEVFAIVVQPDGKILAAGRFTSIGGQMRSRIARLDRTTGLADSFNPNANSDVVSIALQAGGKVLAGGTFSGANSIGGQTRNYIARLDPTTGLADSFDPNANSSVYAIVVQPDGKILAGGFFNGANSIGGQARNYIARLDPTTGQADSFDPNPKSFVYVIALQTDGKILVGGNFSGANSIGGQARNYIARLDATTGLADSFDPNPNGRVLSIALQADGKILASGAFVTIGGQPRNRIGRLDVTTGSADSFNPNANSVVISTTVAADGKILAGGDFTNIGGASRSFFARLSNVAALQNLAVTQSAITWALGGSSPQLTRVSFEYSYDNVNYTVLGDGAAAGSNWTLTGLDFPTGLDFYIRARGCYRSGNQNDSDSLIESVRNAFLPEVALVGAVSRKDQGGTTFDINLPLAGSPGVECRSGGATGDYQLIFSFANPIMSVANAGVTSGTGSVSGRMIDTDPHNYVVNVTGVSNAQVITVSLTNVTDAAGNSSNSVPVSMGVLVGDTSENGSVNSSDVSQTKENADQAVDASNFRTDINASGNITNADVELVKSMSGTSLLPGVKH